MAARKIVYSAKFRRDYVALGAVLIFFAIVFCEIALAVAIPSYLRREEAMARSVRRLELQEQFDSLRRAIRNEWSTEGHSDARPQVCLEAAGCSRLR